MWFMENLQLEIKNEILTRYRDDPDHSFNMALLNTVIYHIQNYLEPIETVQDFKERINVLLVLLRELSENLPANKKLGVVTHSGVVSLATADPNGEDAYYNFQSSRIVRAPTGVYLGNG